MISSKLSAAGKRVIAVIIAVLIVAGAVPISGAINSVSAEAETSKTIYVKSNVQPVIKTDQTYTAMKKEQDGVYCANISSDCSVVLDSYNVLSSNTYFFDNSSAKWSNVYAYMWNDASDKNAEFPGEKATKIDGTDIWYISAKKYNNIIFASGEKVDGKDVKTSDIDISNVQSGYMFNENGKLNEYANRFTNEQTVTYSNLAAKNVYSFSNNSWSVDKIDSANITLRVLDGKTTASSYYNDSSYTFEAGASDNYDYSVSCDDYKGNTWKPTSAQNYTATVTATNKKYSWITESKDFTLSVNEALTCDAKFSVKADNNEIVSNTVVIKNDDTVTVQINCELNNIMYHNTKISKEDMTVAYSVNNSEQSTKNEWKISTNELNSFCEGNNTVTAKITYSNVTIEKTTTFTISTPTITVEANDDNSKVVNKNIYLGSQTLKLKVNGFDDNSVSATFLPSSSTTDEPTSEVEKADNNIVTFDKITDNGKLTVKGTSSGNEVTLEYNVIVVKNITAASIDYSNKNNDVRYWTKDDVTVTINFANQDIINEVTLDNNPLTKKDNKYSFTANGDKNYELTVKTNIKINGKSENKFTVKKEDLYIDKTSPEIQKIEFKSSENKLLNFLTFGLYSNNTINATVTVNDTQSGIADITLSAGTEVEKSFVTNNDGTCSKTFTLNTSKTAYKLSATATDKAGNEKTNSITDNKVQVFVDDSIKTIDSNLFEVVSTLTGPIIVKQADTDDGFYFNDFKFNGEKSIKINDEEIKVYSPEGKVTAEISDELSGLASVSATVNGITDSAITIPKIQKDSEEKPTSKITSADVTLNVKELINEKISPDSNGCYTFSITATDNSGNVSTFDKIFYVDTTPPEITSFSFAKSGKVTDTVLNFLTFGLFSNDNVDVTVTASDEQSGVASITLYKKAENTDEYEEIQTLTVDKNNSATFTLNISNTAYKLSATATDKAGNEKTNSITDKEVQVFFDDSIKTIDSNSFEVVSTTQPATITELKSTELESTELKSTEAEDTNHYQNTKNEDWYSGDVTLSCSATDELSGINLNPNNEEDNPSKIVITDSNTKKEVTVKKFGDTEKTEKGDEFSVTVTADTTIDTGKITKIEIKIVTKNISEGTHAFMVDVFNNSGNTNSATKTVYIDKTAPEITNFGFQPVGKDINGNDAESASANDLESASAVSKTTYGYFFKQNTNVTVTANDAGSGVKAIVFKAKSNENNKVIVNECKETSDSATFNVPANFKGQIYAYAIDNVYNGLNEDDDYYTDKKENNTHAKSNPITPDGVIVENNARHSATSSISITPKVSPVNKDTNGLDLYNQNVPVAIDVKDSYSGIRSINYSVQSDYDKGNNVENGSINVSGNTTQKDYNLSTRVQSAITVKNNSNNIKVTVNLTDNAGNTSSKTIKFSIDKTAPKIAVTYDNNRHTTRDGSDYYKANRTATIVVTERNFSKNDVEAKITNTDSVIPSISNWSESYNSANPDQTTHTATVTYSADGDYTFDIAFKDLAKNTAATYKQDKFTVDKTQPVIGVAFDNNSSLNSNYFKASRTATITINEHNFASGDVKVAINAAGKDNSTPATAPSVSGWSSSGNKRTATVTFVADGKYSFTVDYSDLADNAAKQEKVDVFYVDKTNPQIKITGVENDSANSGEVKPIITFEDSNYTGNYQFSIQRVDVNAKSTNVESSFTNQVVANGSTGATITYNDFNRTENFDGIYTLNADISDKAGNKSTSHITFSVNRFGSTYMLGSNDTKSIINNGYTNKEKDIVISEVNVNNLAKQNVTLSKNNDDLSTLTANKEYTVKDVSTTGKWHRYDYVVKSDNFVDDGYYTITVSSTDAAKHTESNRTPVANKHKLPVSFVIDKTNPKITISGVENDKLYEENSKDVKIECEDSNINPDKLVLKLNDTTLELNKDYQLNKDDVGTVVAKLKIKAKSDISPQDISVTISDLAGNEQTNKIGNFVLSATWIMRFFANIPLVIITFTAIAAIIGVAIFLIGKKRKKSKN